MNDHQQITAERGRRAADLRAAAIALLEQQSIAAGVLLDLDSDQVVAAGPKAAILYLLSNGAPAATSGDAPHLRAAILSLPCEADPALGSIAVHSYKRGHAEARQAAADLVARIESATAPVDAPAAFAKRYSELLCENRRLKAQVESASAPASTGTDDFMVYGRAGNRRADLEAKLREALAQPATASGDELPPIVVDWAACNPVCEESPEMKNAHCACDAAKASICRQRAAVSAATKPTTEQIVEVISHLIGNGVMDWKASESDEAEWDAMSNEEERRALIHEVNKALIAPAAATKPTADLPKNPLAALHDELNRITWEGKDEGWNLAITAVQKRISEILAAPAPAGVARHPDFWRYEHIANGLLRRAEKAEADLASLLATKPAAAPAAKVIINDGKGTATVLLAPAADLKVGTSLYATPAASTTGAAQTAEQVRMAEIGQLIATQDNRITDQPIFIVQQRRRITGLDTDYCENIIWLCSEDEYSEASAEDAAQLEAEYQETGRARSGWVRTGYMDEWEFVTACFTEQGCKDYLKRDGHNLKEPRIYADGSYRNEEFRAVRNFLMSLRSTPTHSSEAGDDGR